MYRDWMAIQNMGVPYILHIVYQPYLSLKLSALLRKQLVEKNSKRWDLYPIVALYNYLLWPRFVASVAMSQLTKIVPTPWVKLSRSHQCYSEGYSRHHLLARSPLQSSYKNRFQYYIVTFQSNSTVAIIVVSKCEWSTQKMEDPSLLKNFHDST